MRKKIAVSILAASMAVLTLGCTGSEKQISGDVETNNQQVVQSVESNDQKAAQSGSTSGYAFTVKGTTITIGAEAADIISALGEPLSRYESPSCAFGDLDVIYTYSGFEVNTYQEKGVDYISAVILNDDSNATQEGLYIGEDEGKAEEIYGTPTSKDAASKTFAKDNMKLMVIFKDGKVASIQYLSKLYD